MLQQGENPAGAFFLVSWGASVFGRVLGHIFGRTAVCHQVLIVMPLARGAACSQSRASACGDERPSPKVCADITSVPSAIFYVSASTLAAPSATISAASAVAAMFSTPVISVWLLLAASYPEFTAFQGKASCAGAKGASDGGCIVAAMAAGKQRRSAPGGRFLAFQPLGLVYHSTLDPCPRELVQ